MKRPLLIVAVGYIIGIVWGLYCKCSIVPFYIIIIPLLIYKNKKNNYKRRFKLFSLRRYFRYVKILLKRNIIITIIISSVFSNFIVLQQNVKYKSLYSEIEDINIIGIIISNPKYKENKTVYKIKVLTINQNNKYKNTYLYLNVNKNMYKLHYGDKVQLNGVFIKPQIQKNYKGFDYANFLKTKKVYGTVRVSKIVIKKQKDINIILLTSNYLFLKIKTIIQNNLPKDVSSLILAFFLGYTDELDENIIQNIRNIGMSHLLAVSGLHISFITLIITFFFNKTTGKKISKIITIILIMCYMFIVGFTPSVVRAGLMGIIRLLGKLLYRKSDTWTSLSLSATIILIYNPFLIESISFVLSFLGTIGIILFSRSIENLLNKIKIKNKKLEYRIKKYDTILNYLKRLLIITISVQLAIIPITAITFNLISFPFIKWYVSTPNTFTVVFYYLYITTVNMIIRLYALKKVNSFQNRIRNIISLIKYKLRLNKNKFIYIIIISSMIMITIKLMPGRLKIYFIDVGQGDSTLIVTPLKKTILIDGGGNKSLEYDVGKNVLLPYLLDRGVTKIDYLIVSHMDSDHVGGLYTVMEELKIKNAIISKQVEKSENFEKFMEISNKNNIRINVVKLGDKIIIEKNIKIYILWPQKEKLIEENGLNNNSIVFKLIYNDFSMLFTGDIEDIAEKQILKKYKNNLEILNTDVLKVAHHGSKTSSSKEFVNAVKPLISLIGVGENNLFGHPNNDVLHNLKRHGCHILRTDLNGEIVLTIDRKGNKQISKHIY